METLPDDGMTGPRRVLVIVNSRGSRADGDLDAPLAVLREAGCEVELDAPDDPARIPDRIRERAEGFDAVVLGGGDGTLSRSAAALLEAKRPLGILPLGTANDLVRTLGIPFEPARAAAVIARGRQRLVDLGRVNGTLFFNAAAVGLSVRVARRLDRETKRRFGVLSYALDGARAAWDRRAFHVDVVCDGVHERLHSIQVHVANGRHYGGGMTARDDAEIDDGRLVLVSVRPRPLLSLLRVLPALRAGRHRGDEPSDLLHGMELEMRTRHPHEISTDGELTGCRTPARFDVLRRALSVYVPGEPDAEPSGREA